MQAFLGTQARSSLRPRRRDAVSSLSLLVIGVAIVWKRGKVWAGEGPGGVVGVGPSADSAEASYRRGKVAKDSSERKRCFQEGMARAKSRLSVQADDPEGLYWLAVNTGAEALERGRFQALPALPEMERLLLRCHAVAPTFENAGPARVLGRLYHKAPAVISIGSNKKARQWLEIALATAPEFPGNLAFAADFLSTQGEPQRAVSLARKCLSLLSTNRFGADGDEWKQVASEVVEDAR